MRKEKTYKTPHEACKYQKEGECAVFDKKKKAYVNIKTFSPFVDPFDYSINDALFIATFIGYAMFALGGGLTNNNIYKSFLIGCSFFGGTLIVYWYRYLIGLNICDWKWHQ